jgi:tRNA pseudouridine55 synthase
MTDFSTQDIWLNINKPVGISSARVVAIVKRKTKAKKVGHGGTLDMLADGVLPIALNKATKTSQAMMDCNKKYAFTIKWGGFTTTDDAEGEIIETSEIRPETSAINLIIPKFLGFVKQVPSKFSAIKIDGKRAYDLARKGVEFEMKSREINIFSLKLLENDENCANFEVKCSKGTYVRTLAHDICAELKTCGHVIKLTRLEVGDFKIEDAIEIESL